MVGGVAGQWRCEGHDCGMRKGLDAKILWLFIDCYELLDTKISSCVTEL
jgi:hypothetical protein